MQSETLYINDNNGNLRVWQIHQETTHLYIVHGQYGGKMQEKTEYIEHGKAGRSIEQQIESRFNSRIKKQLDKGYTVEKPESGQRPVNTLGFTKPMLALRSEKVKVKDFTNAMVQRKYNGHRCLVKNENGMYTAYSRQGKIIKTIDHILTRLDIPEGTTLDGEIYRHEMPLQDITSLVKKVQPGNEMLEYHIYDVVQDKPYWERADFLQQYVGNMFVSTCGVNNMAEARRKFASYRDEGYEGAILRVGDKGYEDGKRSNSLIKIKEVMDTEVRVDGIEKSKDGLPVLHCMTTWGTTVKVLAPGTQADKVHVLRHPEKYIHRQLQIEYYDLTRDNVPFHPVATRWHEVL